MQFFKFPSIVNVRSKAFMKCIEFLGNALQGVHFVVTEKIHGANIQIASNGRKEKIGRRTDFIAPDDKFYGIHQEIPQLTPLYAMINELSNTYHAPVVLFGEFFGGKVQREIFYQDGKSFRFFALYIDGVRQSFSVFKDIMEAYGLEDWMVPVLAYCKSLEDAVGVAANNYSKINPHTMAEGAVMEPLYVAGVPEMVFKYVNDCFLEKKASSEKAVKSAKSVIVSPSVLKLRTEFATYLTEMRMSKIMTKEGMIENNSQIGAYVKLFMEDAKNDFLADNAEARELSKADLKYVMNAGSTPFNILKTFL